MASLKVAREYFVSSQSQVLIPDSDYGNRKLIHIGITSGNQGVLSRKLSQQDQSWESSEVQSPPSSPSSPPQLSKSPMQPVKSKQWVHPPETLLRGHIVYNVKFLGECEVESAKGTDVVKDAIRKRKFNKHIRKAEGQKTPKVELTISADGVTIQDPKSKMIMHQYPLHRISYCADDKTDKRMLTFIAKAGDSDKHFCYVFSSEKCAEEITLTIGQAFDLAYRRFLETSSRDLDLKKNYIILQKKANSLEKENIALKVRVKELESQLGETRNQRTASTSDPTEDPPSSLVQYENLDSIQLKHSASLMEESTDEPYYSDIPPKQTAVGRTLENLFFEEETNGSARNGSVNGSSTPGVLSPPPPSTRSRSQGHSTSSPTTTGGTKMEYSRNPFESSFNPSSIEQPSSTDPFGMPSFNPNSSMDLDLALQNINDEISDKQTGFSQGLMFGTDDFSLEDFDPLNQK